MRIHTRSDEEPDNDPTGEDVLNWENHWCSNLCSRCGGEHKSISCPNVNLMTYKEKK